MDYITFALLCEELERGDTAFRVVQSVHVGLNSLTLLQWGTEEQRQRWLVPQARGEKLATFGLTEPGVGHRRGEPRDDRAPRGRPLRPQRPEDLDQPRGHRRPLPGLRVGGSGSKHRGVTAFVVERGMEGLTTGTLHGKLGIRAGNTGLVTSTTCASRSRTGSARRARAS